MLTGMMRLSADSIGGGLGREERTPGAACRARKPGRAYFNRKGASGEGLAVRAIFLRARQARRRERARDAIA
jgi:hypothetical protein